MMKYGALFLLLFSSLSHGRAIYGEDNRIDVYASKNPLHRELGRSILAMIPQKKISSKDTLKEELSVCKNERFAEQQATATCTGFLVSNKHIVTAGHCVSKLRECDVNQWVFDYALSGPGQTQVEIKRSNIYSCKRIVHTINSTRKKKDWAVIELDREVVGRRPLVLSERGKPLKGESVFVMGHPSGLPLKVAAGAQIRSVQNDYFVANLDTFQGNSGSPVFNSKTGEVEGILVRGEVDYKEALFGLCQKVRTCPENGCRGEEASLIERILPYLPKK